MTNKMMYCIKTVICSVAIIAAVAAISSCKMSKKYKLRRAAQKTIRGVNGIICGMKELFR